MRAEEALGVSEEEPTPTSPLSHPSRRRGEERCGGGWSFPPPIYMREEEWCGGGWSFPPPAYAKEEEQCRSREKQTSRSGLRHASSRALSAC
jgi:hypothetical protein